MATLRSVARPTEFRIMAALLLSVDRGIPASLLGLHGLADATVARLMSTLVFVGEVGDDDDDVSGRLLWENSPVSQGRCACDGKQQPRLATRLVTTCQTEIAAAKTNSLLFASRFRCTPGRIVRVKVTAETFPPSRREKYTGL